MAAGQNNMKNNSNARAAQNIKPACCDVKAQAEPQVYEQVDRLMKAGNRLLDAASLLAKRLEPVTRPETSELCDPAPAPEELVPLATRLRAECEVFTRAAGCIESLLNRLEV